MKGLDRSTERRTSNAVLHDDRFTPQSFGLDFCRVENLSFFASFVSL